MVDITFSVPHQVNAEPDFAVPPDGAQICVTISCFDDDVPQGSVKGDDLPKEVRRSILARVRQHWQASLLQDLTRQIDSKNP